MSEVREFVALSLVRAAARWGIDPDGRSAAEIEALLNERVARRREIVTAEGSAGDSALIVPVAGFTATFRRSGNR